MTYLLKVTAKNYRLAYNCHVRFFSTPAPIVFSEEVRRAKAEGRPIVALESTIITHGMPYPHNLETAIQLEEIIRQRGAVPATVAILKGQLTIGLSKDKLEYLAQAKGVIKASRRDLAPIVAAQLDGATTVAGTIIAAELSGIPVFVTGGIGGVHREGERTMDISADLSELGRSRTLVVCSGVKSILDIGRTLEYLETQGVCVCAFGDSDDFPAFYTRKSGYKAPYQALDAEHAARLLFASRTLNLSSGIVMAVPVPEEHAMDEKIIESAIKLALEKASEKGIKGKEVTPFILAAVAKATGGTSLASNIALIKNNAQVGADIAVEFKKLRNSYDSENAFHIGVSKSAEKFSPDSRKGIHSSCVARNEIKNYNFEDFPMFVNKNLDGDVLVIGGANVDRTYRVKERDIQFDGSTHACITQQCGGGVGRNMAEALWRLRNGRAKLLTTVGDDADGQYISDIAPGLLLNGCVVAGGRTPTYAAVLDNNGECLIGLGDMDLHGHISVELVNKHLDVLEKAPLVVIDGNPPQATIDHVLQLCDELDTPVFFEPTDRRKAAKILHCKRRVALASPNLSELKSMALFLDPATKCNEIIELAKIVSNAVQILIITLGVKGTMIVRHHSSRRTVRMYPVSKLNDIENVSGAGDCFASGFICGALAGLSESKCVKSGFQSAMDALLCKNTVPSNLKHNYSTIIEAHYHTM